MRRAGLLASACAALSVAVAPMHAVAQPSIDERVATSVRYEADDMERRIVRSGLRNTDPALNDYLKRIGCAVAAERCDQLRFYVLETPAFNASMAPNGMMLINSGLLLRVESEAELAFVMAHEFNHYADNDTVEIMSRIRSANAGGLVLMIGLSLAGAGALSQLGYLGAAANVMSFSREQERESDMFAARFANANNYDSMAGVRAWENVRTEMLASSNEQTRRRYTRGSIFSTHPLTEERIAYLREQPNTHPGAGDDKAAFRTLVRPHLRRWLDAEITARDPGASLALFDRLAAPGMDMGLIEYARGEVYRYRDGEGDAARALQSYTNAVAHADAPAEAWRQIGVVQRKLGDTVAADAAFRRYLDAAPNASDRLLIAMMITTPQVAPTQTAAAASAQTPTTLPTLQPPTGPVTAPSETALIEGDGQ